MPKTGKSVRQILRFNAGRDPERLALKYRNMRADPFVFLRATCHLFYARLPGATVLEAAPAAWACGDLHLENFGSYKGDNRLVYFDINDFDEALLAPATWDLVRFLASLLVGRASLHASHEDALGLCRAYLEAYGAALAQGKARWVERETASGPVGELLASLRDRHRPEFLDRRTELKRNRRHIRIDGHKALAATVQQRGQVMEFFEGFARQQPDPGFFKVLDVARRIAGNGSLGVDRFIVLVQGKGSPDGNYLLDLKQALPSALRKRVALAQPAWTDEAQRTVFAQRCMQAIPMAFLHPVHMGSHAYVLRGLQPSEDRVSLDRSAPDAHGLLTALGQCTAWAQLRSSGRKGAATADELIDFGRRTRWHKALIATAQECAAQVEADWREYSAAFDDGVFAL